MWYHMGTVRRMRQPLPCLQRKTPQGHVCDALRPLGFVKVGTFGSHVVTCEGRKTNLPSIVIMIRMLPLRLLFNGAFEARSFAVMVSARFTFSARLRASTTCAHGYRDNWTRCILYHISARAHVCDEPQGPCRPSPPP